MQPGTVADKSCKLGLPGEGDASDATKTHSTNNLHAKKTRAVRFYCKRS